MRILRDHVAQLVPQLVVRLSLLAAIKKENLVTVMNDHIEVKWCPALNRFFVKRIPQCWIGDISRHFFILFFSFVWKKCAHMRSKSADKNEKQCRGSL